MRIQIFMIFLFSFYLLGCDGPSKNEVLVAVEEHYAESAKMSGGTSSKGLEIEVLEVIKPTESDDRYVALARINGAFKTMGLPKPNEYQANSYQMRFFLKEKGNKWEVVRIEEVKN